MPASPDPSDDPASGGKRRKKIWSIPVFTAGVLTALTLAGFGYLFSFWASGGHIEPHEKLRLASSQYIAGNALVAGNLADQVVLDDESEDEQTWVMLQKFLSGAGKFDAAIRTETPRDRLEALRNAVDLLESSLQIGFPPGRGADGYRMLGIANAELGDYDSAMPQLQKAIDLNLNFRQELAPLLAIAKARSMQANYGGAIAAIDEVLDRESLDSRARTDAETLKINWLIESKEFAKADDVIENARTRIRPDVQRQEPWAIKAADDLRLLHSQSVVDAALERIVSSPGAAIIAGVPVTASDQIDEAQRTQFTTLVRDLMGMQRESIAAISARSRLVAAQALLLAGEDDLALAELTLVRQQRPFRDEGFEGALSEIELLAYRELGDEVLQTTRYLVREIIQSRHLLFTTAREAEFKSRMNDVLSRLRAAGKYESAVETASAVTRLHGVAEASIQKGLAYRDWGDATLEQGRGPGDEISREAFEQARARFRGAGDAFATAAQEQFNSKQYVTTLWSAIDAYQRGRHFSKSIVLLENYLRYEERLRQPQGLVAHGRALLAEGQPVAAMRSLETCISEFPRDPMRYEARLLAAQAAADSRDFEKAKIRLQENLDDGQLTPQSPVWRDSLFTLGELLYSECDIETLAASQMELDEQIAALRKIEPKLAEASRRLNEATDRYWPYPRAQAASYLYARGQLLAAELPETELRNEPVLDAARRDFRMTSARHRQSALDRFGALIQYFDTLELDTELSDKQQAILRNSLIGQADTLKSMQRYTEAADAYRDMSLRYLNEPPALEAILGQVRMLGLLGRDREAESLLRQAIIILDRIEPIWDDRFEELTRFNRAGWKKYLTWIDQRTDQAATAGNAVR